MQMKLAAQSHRFQLVWQQRENKRGSCRGEGCLGADTFPAGRPVFMAFSGLMDVLN